MAPGENIGRDVAALATPEGRRAEAVERRGYRAECDYMRGTMEEIGLALFRGGTFELLYTWGHPVTGEPTNFVNLVGVARGTVPGLPPVLGGAHYDSVIDGPCVDNNAAAVAMALAVAEGLVTNRPKKDVVIAIFPSVQWATTGV